MTADSSARGPRIPRRVLLPNLLLLGLSLVGASYYFAPLAVRVRHEWHPWLRSSGYVGQALGLLAFLGFVFLWLYPLRKRARWMASMGNLGGWLEVHIMVGLTVPVLAAVHAGWRFTGLIGLGYLAMFVVFLSGVVGRYLYVHIPRSKAGLELGMEEAAQQRRELLAQLVGITGLEEAVVQSVLAAEPPRGGGLVATLLQMMRDDRARRRSAKELRRRWEQLGPDRPPLDQKALKRVAELARRQMALGQQLRLLERTQRIFKLWHVAHLPFAITALIAVGIHVVVAVLVGATWFY